MGAVRAPKCVFGDSSFVTHFRRLFTLATPLHNNTTPTNHYYYNNYYPRPSPLPTGKRKQLLGVERFRFALLFPVLI